MNKGVAKAQHHATVLALEVPMMLDAGALVFDIMAPSQESRSTARTGRVACVKPRAFNVGCSCSGQRDSIEPQSKRGFRTSPPLSGYA